MRRIFGRILQIIGWLGAAWVGGVGGCFSLVYLTGFIGTGGREAGRELGFALLVTISGVIVCLIVAKIGAWVARHDSHSKA